MRVVRGFTLVELVVTITVIAIIAALAVPSFSRLLTKQKLKANTRDLISFLVNAKSQAVFIHQPITVNLNSNATDTATTKNWINSSEITKSATTNSLVFQQDGRIGTRSGTSFVPATSNIEITLCASNTYSQKISISNFGTVLQNNVVEGCSS